MIVFQMHDLSRPVPCTIKIVFQTRRKLKMVFDIYRRRDKLIEWKVFRPT